MVPLFLETPIYDSQGWPGMPGISSPSEFVSAEGHRYHVDLWLWRCHSSHSRGKIGRHGRGGGSWDFFFGHMSFILDIQVVVNVLNNFYLVFFVPLG